MEEFVKCALAAEKKLQEAIANHRDPVAARRDWEETMWRARNWLPNDSVKLEEKGAGYLNELQRKRWAKIKRMPDVAEATKSPERKALEAAGLVPAYGPNPSQDYILICRPDGDLLRPMAHYYHGRSQWWNLVNPPRDTKTKQGRGVPDLLKALKEIP